MEKIENWQKIMTSRFLQKEKIISKNDLKNLLLASDAVGLEHPVYFLLVYVDYER